MIKTLLLAAALAALGFGIWWHTLSDVEQARYTIIESHGNIEIRDYEPMIVAETKASGQRQEAINDGFRSVANYIFGGNKTNEKIAMTAPVMQQNQGSQSGDTWMVQFMMPAQYASVDALPLPGTNNIALKNLPPQRYAVIRFSGLTDQDNLDAHKAQLLEFIAKQKLATNSAAPIYAFFNPPWTLPFLRRNEIMIALSPDAQQ